MTLRRIAFLSLAAILLCSGYSAAKPPGGGKPKAKVELLPSVDGVVAGQPFDVAIHFKIDNHWHIYWQNSGESGQPPRIKWNLPSGFSAGAFRYPVPKRHTDPSGYITTNILEGTPSLLVRITPPPTLSSDTVIISGDLKYLICDKICLQESAALKVTLPARSSAADVHPANTKVFLAARKARPSTQSQYVAVRATVKPGAEKLKPGTEFELLVTVTVAKGYRIFAPSPAPATMTVTDLFVERVPGLFIDPAEFPDGAVRTDAKLGRLTEYSGSLTIRVPGEVDVDVQPPFSFGGVLTYQACDADGKCADPDALAWTYHPFEQAGNVPGQTRTEGHSSSVGTGAPTGTGATPVHDAGVGASAGTTDVPSDDRNGLVAQTSSEKTPDSDSGSERSFFGWLALAFLGGLILNVMPCVLPVISIKILSFVQQSKEDPARVVKLGLTFCLGMLISFWVLAGVIIAFKAAGEELGWGFQFQSPRFVIVMMTLMFVFGLSLLGVFDITLPGATASKLAAAEEREGYLGAFMKGVLGMVLATPCLAPYLGPALNVAFKSSSGELFAIFTAVGLGMASPFAILSVNPKWMKFLPKPGPWMEHFKQLMGFLLMGTVVWLMFTLGTQIGASGLTRACGFLVVLGLACWLLGRQTPMTSTPRRYLAWVTAVTLAVTGWWVSFERSVTVEAMIQDVRLAKVCPCEAELPQIAAEDWDRRIPWQPWTKGRPEDLAAQGYTVYVDYTATWCPNCLANKHATLETEAVREAMRDLCVVPIKADYTSYDEDIFADLQRFDRSGIPLNVIYPAGRPDAPIVMPEQLVGRTRLVLDRLVQAGASLMCTRTPSSDATGQTDTPSTSRTASSAGSKDRP